jgi:hypothetical protein
VNATGDKAKQRNKEIWTLYQSDNFYWNSQKLAIRYDLTERQVNNILYKFKAGEHKRIQKEKIRKFIEENPGVDICNHPEFIG